MKKMFSLIIVMFLCIISLPSSVFAENITSLEVESDNNEMHVYGTSESDVYAVAVLVYQDSNLVYMETCSSDGNYSCTLGKSFENGEYQVKVADYDGGDYLTDDIEIEYEDSGDDDQNQDEQETYTVTFDSNGGSAVEPFEVVSGDTVDYPSDPTNGDKIFGGWFEDDTFSREFNFETEITNDITLFALWLEPDTEIEYTITDDNGNEIMFNNLVGNNYTFTIMDYLSYTKEEVLEITGMNSDEYDEIMNLITNAVKDEGTLLGMFEIYVTNQDDENISEGPFTIKIKLTEEMKKYNTLKLIYIDDDYNIESPIYLTIDGDYATGVLPHLSMYTLVGSNTSDSNNISESSTSNDTTSNNPKTGDNIFIWFVLCGISILCLLIGFVITHKIKKSKIK